MRTILKDIGATFLVALALAGLVYLIVTTLGDPVPLQPDPEVWWVDCLPHAAMDLRCSFRGI